MAKVVWTTGVGIGNWLPGHLPGAPRHNDRQSLRKSPQVGRVCPSAPRLARAQTARWDRRALPLWVATVVETVAKADVELVIRGERLLREQLMEDREDLST